jgi:N-acetylglucosamine kinase-like BadF-type ATPase
VAIRRGDPGDNRIVSSQSVLLGVDGGNTKSIAVVGRPDGQIVGAARTLRGSDIHAVPADEALEVLFGVADEALRIAGATDAAVAGSAFSLAGADWPEDYALLEGRLRARWPRAVVVNDAIGALRATIPDGPGVVIVCGTGTATGARGPDGRTWHSSFWQEPQGAHELGVLALQAVLRAELGIDDPTALTARLLAVSGEPDVESLLHHATGREIVGRRDPAIFAASLLDVAEEGDETARQIVIGHGAALARTALAAARRVGIGPADPFALALVGGVIRHAGRTLRNAIVDTVRDRSPLASVVAPTLEPAAGALLLAFDAAGVAVDDGVEARLRASAPAAALFDTHPQSTAPRA